MSLKNTSLCGYGAKALKRDKYKCKYCGFDGSTFDNWLQMSVDHVIPVSATDTPDHSIDNLVACCKACNSRKCCKEVSELFGLLFQFCFL
ncbi:MAG: HNH endonuclease [Thaumarchaeota archaeon]|nr:HNH endonuclease [Nitrososphaerota archaeon]